MIHTGDCIEVMRTLPADSVDAICTDPPYGLEFMGKAWDSPLRNGWQAEPGRYHNDSNFLATGDRIRYKAGHPFQAWCQSWGTEALRVTKPGGYLLAFGGTRTHHRLVCGLEDAGWIIRDELDWIYASGFPKGKANLKPAHEPIVLARKPGPLRPLGIEECRIPSTEDLNGGAYTEGREPRLMRPGGGKTEAQPKGPFVQPVGRWPSNLLLSDPELFDEPNPYVVGSGAVSNPPGGPGRQAFYPGGEVVNFTGEHEQGPLYFDGGGYSRFFIVPKSSRSDREPIITPDGHDRAKRFSTHPTQKPTDLMAHLIRLVCPPDGVILDPFLGSGSTAVAAEREGVKWIGIEKEPEYVAIAEARLNGTQRGLGLDVGAPTKASPKQANNARRNKANADGSAGAGYGGGWEGIKRAWGQSGEEPVA